MSDTKKPPREGDVLPEIHGNGWVVGRTATGYYLHEEGVDRAGAELGQVLFFQGPALPGFVAVVDYAGEAYLPEDLRGANDAARSQVDFDLEGATIFSTFGFPPGERSVVSVPSHADRLTVLRVEWTYLETGQRRAGRVHPLVNPETSPAEDPFVLVRGANYSRHDACVLLTEIEEYCQDDFMYGPAGLAHAVRIQVRCAPIEELVDMLHTTLWHCRNCRATSRFAPWSALSNQRPAFALIARILLGVIRHERSLGHG